MPQFLSDLVLPRDPDAALEAATKQYVDTHGGGGSGTPEVYADDDVPVVAATIVWVDTDSVVTEGGSGGPGTPEVYGQTDVPVVDTNIVWVDTDSTLPLDTGGLPGLPLAGGTMTGPINMGTSKITNLGTPTTGTDAATKAYTDSKVPLVLGPTDPIPGGTPAGTVIIRTET